MMWQLAALKGQVKHYDWGGYQYIPFLLKIENPGHQPFAEYWMGTHPQAQCFVVKSDGNEVLLRDETNLFPELLLGSQVSEQFGDLPYLLKVLDVKDMLSIQVHPSKAMAIADFAAENEKGVVLTASNRNYKDANHKPELMVAMSGFYLLHGFKPEAELTAVLETVPELQLFKDAFAAGGYKAMYQLAMELPQEQVNEILQPLLNRIIPLYQQQQLDKNKEDFWAARAALTFNRPGIIDRGIFSIYFFNVLHLQEGDAIFQDAGVPHAYLEGYNVELMASSDNVLRGGLTTKHIDTVELLKHTRCEATHPDIIPASQKSEITYKTPADDFELTGYQLTAGQQQSVHTHTLEIFLLMKGAVSITDGAATVLLDTGNIAAVAANNTKLHITASEDARLFRASVPAVLNK